MFALEVAGIVLAWIAYSVWQKRRLKPVFAAMQLLSETRRPHGSLEHAVKVAKSLQRIDKIPKGWNFVAGDPKAKGGPIYRAGDSVVCQFNANESAYGLYVPKTPKTMSLPESIAKRPHGTYIEEDLASRANYMSHAQSSLSAERLPHGTSVFRGSYEWCFRDYVTHEELFGMLASRSCVEKTLFYPLQIGRLTVTSNGDCKLHERSLVFGFVPLQIFWYGKLNHQTAIAWETTSLRLGWNRFGKTFDKPAASERLRQDKWFVRYPLGYEKNGDFIVLHRENRGCLVYSRKK